MKYNIISLNNPERQHYGDAIKYNVPFDEVNIPAVDGRFISVNTEYGRRGLRSTKWVPKMGEAGVWLSNFDCWQWAAHHDEPLIVFEDDAVVGPGFERHFNNFYRSLPDDWDFCSLWVPENQLIDYRYDVTFNEQGDPVHQGPLREYGDSLFKDTLFTAKVYQGYGMVSLMYSPQGGRKLIELSRSTGITTPVDCYVYQHAHRGDLVGYAPTPIFSRIVKYDWSAETTVQKTEKVQL